MNEIAWDISIGAHAFEGLDTCITIECAIAPTFAQLIDQGTSGRLYEPHVLVVGVFVWVQVV